jgi:hypothetical protein
VSLNDHEVRRGVLLDLGASSTSVEEILAYSHNRIVEEGAPELPSFPLPDEPHLGAWREYAECAAESSAWQALRTRLAQLQFPVREGMSGDDAYLRATRRGLFPPPLSSSGLELSDGDNLDLVLHPCIAGTVPLLTPANREDFVSLVRAFTARNEPATVPDSMGACMVAGLNNWDRVHAHRRKWEAANPDLDHASAWSDEFRNLVQRKELYQDRFIILSRGPYSNVAASEIGASDDEWVEMSYRIRRDHECTHYFSLRVFGCLLHNLLEELIADYVGIVQTCGAFRADLAMRFLGLEDYPDYRSGGRLEVYRGDPPLSDEAFAVLTGLAARGIDNLTLVDQRWPYREESIDGLARLVCALTLLTLEEMAAPGIVERVQDRMGLLFGEGFHGSA